MRELCTEFEDGFFASLRMTFFFRFAVNAVATGAKLRSLNDFGKIDRMRSMSRRIPLCFFWKCRATSREEMTGVSPSGRSSTEIVVWGKVSVAMMPSFEGWLWLGTCPVA
jgi:hypothetical protein